MATSCAAPPLQTRSSEWLEVPAWTLRHSLPGITGDGAPMTAGTPVPPPPRRGLGPARQGHDRRFHPADSCSLLGSDTVVLGEGLLGTLRQWDVEMWSDVDRDMTEWLHEARAAGLKTALLSNMHPDMALYARRSFDWLQHLNCVILSCEVRLIKPDYAIYKRCLEGIELLPFEACFIDDRDANVGGARDVGLN